MKNKILLLFIVVFSTILVMGCKISGKVVDKDGQGLDNITVQLEGAGKDANGKSKIAITDSEGNYSFDGISNGTYKIYPNMTGKQFEPSEKIVQMSISDVKDINFTLTPTQHWSGRGFFDRYKALWGSWAIQLMMSTYC